MKNLDQALKTVLSKNINSNLDSNKLTDFTNLVLKWIPQEVKNEDSFSIGTRGSDKYISVNIMNYLIFRIPGFKDNGSKGEFDFIFLSTRAMTKKLYGELPPKPKERTFNFSKVSCDNIYLWLDEIDLLTKDHINDFKKACIMLLRAPKTRSQKSNIKLNN